ATVGFASAVGDSFRIINNDGSEGVGGTFSGLPEGSVFTPTGAPAGDYYQITYVGGTGNDVVITHIQAPILAPPSDQQSVEGAVATIDLGSFIDADGRPWAVDVDWGDGTPHTTFMTNSAGSLGQQTHVYADEGLMTVAVTVTDSTNLSAVASFSVDVLDIAPTVAADNSAVSAAEDGAATNSGTFSDYDDAVTITVSSGTITQSGTQSGTWSWSGR